MTGNSSLTNLWKKTDKYRFILAMSIVAAIALRVPLQTYMTLGRYQHIGIALFLFGMGYLMQMIWSWRDSIVSARVCNAATSAFFCSVGMFFYANAWLDSSIAEPTADQIELRSNFVILYLVLAFSVACIWLKRFREERKAALQSSLPEQNKEA